MGKLIYTIALLGMALTTHSQELPGGLTGNDARTWIKTNYYDSEHTALTYSEARKKMFAYIANVNDSVQCVYSGLLKYLEEGDESTAYPAPFNTEHVIPQSIFGSNEPMRSDIHILQPAFEDWNSARSAFPFREINDNSTDQWYYLDQSTTSIPTQNIDRYSELLNNTAWEPRESRKGDVARAIMYFFTMYPAYNINAVIENTELCDWHEQDPVDALELQRNELTEVYQGNINPYIFRPHWANQAWGCSVTPPANIPPTAVDDAATTELDGTVVLNVLTNDSDVDGSLDPSSVTIISAPSNGMANTNVDGFISYDPNEGFIGMDTFTYVVCDDAVIPECDTADVVITVAELTAIHHETYVALYIYPNPTSGALRFKLQGNIEYPVNADVLDAMGRMVKTFDVFSADVAIRTKLPDGSYFLVIRDRLGIMLSSSRFQVIR